MISDDFDIGLKTIFFKVRYVLLESLTYLNSDIFVILSGFTHRVKSFNLSLDFIELLNYKDEIHFVRFWKELISLAFHFKGFTFPFSVFRVLPIFLWCFASLHHIFFSCWPKVHWLTSPHHRGLRSDLSQLTRRFRQFWMRHFILNNKHNYLIPLTRVLSNANF